MAIIHMNKRSLQLTLLTLAAVSPVASAYAGIHYTDIDHNMVA